MHLNSVVLAMRIYFTGRADAAKPPQHVFWPKPLTALGTEKMALPTNPAANVRNVWKLPKAPI